MSNVVENKDVEVIDAESKKTGFFTFVTRENPNGNKGGSMEILLVKMPGKKWRQFGGYPERPSLEEVEADLAKLAQKVGLDVFRAIPYVVPILQRPGKTSFMVQLYATEKVPFALIEGTALQMFSYLPDWTAEVIGETEEEPDVVVYDVAIAYERKSVEELEETKPGE